MPLVLGSVIFQDFEIPDKLPLGGAHALTVHKLLGGQRIVNAMGPDDRDIEWSGLLFGPLATPRALILDALRISGQSLPLSVDTIMRTVVVRQFHWDYERFYQIRYSITCVVTSAPGLFGGPASLDDLVSVDMLAVAGLASSFAAAVFS